VSRIVAFLLLVFLVSGNPIRVQSAEPDSRAGAQTELTTVTGDHLTGRALRFDCRGLSLTYFGNSLQVPLSKLTRVASEGEVAVFPGNGTDQITGKLTVNGGTVFVMTRDLGKVELPITAFRCNGKTPREAPVAENDSPKSRARTRLEGEEQFESTTAARRRLAGLEPRGLHRRGKRFHRPRPS
jgi:hypothetical protein